MEIAWGFHETPFGPALFAITGPGLCGLDFVVVGGAKGALARLRSRWPSARLVERPRASAGHAEELRRRLRGAARDVIEIVLAGSPFRVKVHRALLAIPYGTVTTYGRIAKVLGIPGAARAVGRAVGDNPIGCFVPCHRVIRANGDLGGYFWGPSLKRALLDLERNCASTTHAPAEMIRVASVCAKTGASRSCQH